jgi:hypothetical protein
MRNFSFLCHACYRAHLQGLGWHVNTIVVGGFSLPIIARGSSLDLLILGGSSEWVKLCLHPFLCLRSLPGITSCAFTAVMDIISHAFTAIFDIITRAFTATFGLRSLPGISSCAFTAVCRHGHHLSCVHCHLWHYHSCVHCHLWHHIFRY